MMVSCSSISLDDECGAFDECDTFDVDARGELGEKKVATRSSKKIERIKFSEMEKVALETISNECGKCAAYYKYVILAATTTDEAPFENIDEVGQKQSLSVKYAMGLAVNIWGGEAGAAACHRKLHE